MPAEGQARRRIIALGGIAGRHSAARLACSRGLTLKTKSATTKPTKSLSCANQSWQLCKKGNCGDKVRNGRHRRQVRGSVYRSDSAMRQHEPKPGNVVQSAQAISVTKTLKQNPLMSVSLRALVRPAMLESEFDLLAEGAVQSTVGRSGTGRCGSVSLRSTKDGRKEEQCLSSAKRAFDISRSLRPPSPRLATAMEVSRGVIAGEFAYSRSLVCECNFGSRSLLAKPCALRLTPVNLPLALPLAISSWRGAPDEAGAASSKNGSVIL